MNFVRAARNSPPCQHVAIFSLPLVVPSQFLLNTPNLVQFYNMASLYDLLKTVRGLGGGAGGNGGAGAGAGQQASPAARSRTQAEQELLTWHAIKAWVAKEELKIAREEEYVTIASLLSSLFHSLLSGTTCAMDPVGNIFF